MGTRPFSRFLAVLSNPNRRHGEDCEQPGESARPYHALAAPPRRWLRRDPHPPLGAQRVSASSGMAAAVPGRRGRVRSPRGGRRGEESIASLRGGRGAGGRGSGDQVYPAADPGRPRPTAGGSPCVAGLPGQEEPDSPLQRGKGEAGGRELYDLRRQIEWKRR